MPSCDQFSFPKVPLPSYYWPTLAKVLSESSETELLWDSRHGHVLSYCTSGVVLDLQPQIMGRVAVCSRPVWWHHELFLGPVMQWNKWIEPHSLSLFNFSLCLLLRLNTRPSRFAGKMFIFWHRGIERRACSDSGHCIKVFSKERVQFSNQPLKDLKISDSAIFLFPYNMLQVSHKSLYGITILLARIRTKATTEMNWETPV